MFDGLKDMGKLLKQAKEMKSKMKTVQDELKKVLVSGFSKDKKIEVIITGELEVKSINIPSDLLSQGDSNGLQKNITAAVNDAIVKAKELATSKLSAISVGMNLPGLS